MKEFCYRISDPNGLHARPAGALANLAKQFECKICVTMGEKTVDAKRLLSLMSLGAKHGDEVCFLFDGADEEDAMQKLQAHLSM